VLSPVSTTRINGPSWRVTDFHYPSTRLVETRPSWRVMETGHPSTRAVNSGSGNRALSSRWRCGCWQRPCTCLVLVTTRRVSTGTELNDRYANISVHEAFQPTCILVGQCPSVCLSVRRIAQWLERRSLTGELPLSCTWLIVGTGDHFVDKLSAMRQPTQPFILPGSINE